MQARNKDLGKIFILCDYRNQFYFSSKRKGASLDIQLLVNKLKQYFDQVEVTSFNKINNFNVFKNTYVLYHTSEDPGLKYKDYIEDTILAIQCVGAILLPKFELFRAHHNKVFAELFIKSNGIEMFTHVPALTYGTFEEYYHDLVAGNQSLLKKELVFKRPNSTKSSGVFRLSSKFSKIIIPFLYSLTFNFDNLKRYMINLVLNNGYTRQSDNRKKFLVQEFLYSPNGDFRVIIYWDHFYVLHRKNRKNDFRASGSGNFNFSKNLPNGLLDYCRQLFAKFDCPYMAIDVGMSGDRFVTYEFQAISMGQYAAENAPHYFQYRNVWECKIKDLTVEEEIVRSVVNYIHYRKT